MLFFKPSRYLFFSTSSTWKYDMCTVYLSPLDLCLRKGTVGAIRVENNSQVLCLSAPNWKTDRRTIGDCLGVGVGHAASVQVQT
jgi:hypothetical protein